MAITLISKDPKKRNYQICAKYTHRKYLCQVKNQFDDKNLYES